MKKLHKSYGPLPSDPAEQDRLFYSIYKRHADDVGVLDAHKSYLAARDIATINLLLLFMLVPLAWWAIGNHARIAAYAIALFASYAVMSIAAQAYGTRLVQNSLAVASQSFKKVSS